MHKSTYIVAFDPLDPRIDLEHLASHIKQSSEFAAWWHHIPFVFLVTSPLNADQIADRLRPYANQSSFLVMQVNPTDSEGLLPEQAWNWIKNQEDSSNRDFAQRALEPQEQA